MATTRARCASVSLHHLSRLCVLITLSFDWDVCVSSQYLRLFRHAQQRVQTLTQAAQIAKYKPCTRQGYRRWTLIGPITRNQPKLAIVKLDFDKVCTIPLSMMLDHWKGLSPQWVCGMGDAHKRGMRFYVCFW